MFETSKQHEKSTAERPASCALGKVLEYAAESTNVWHECQ